MKSKVSLTDDNYISIERIGEEPQTVNGRSFVISELYAQAGHIAERIGQETDATDLVDDIVPLVNRVIERLQQEVIRLALKRIQEETNG